MKKHILHYILLLFVLPLTAQEYHQDNSYSFSDEKTGWHIYEAQNSIKLSDGFTYSATSGESFTGKVNPKLLFPDMKNAYLKTDGSGETTDKPEEGYAVGAIPGIFNVSPTGAATYTIPIEVPPGVNGMQPNIALSYDSQAGNGIAGWGWNIAGLSAISRVPKTIYYDGEVKEIQWDDTDALALDGQRLFEISRGGDSIVYATEVDNGSKIVGYGITEYGVDRFTVYTRDGKELSYVQESPISKKRDGWMLFLDVYENTLSQYPCATIHGSGHLTYEADESWTWSSLNEEYLKEAYDVRFHSWKLVRVQDKNENYISFKYDNGYTVVNKKNNAFDFKSYYGVDCASPSYNADTYGEIFNSSELDELGNIYYRIRGEACFIDSLKKNERIDYISYGNKGDELAKIQFHYEGREQHILGYLAGCKMEQSLRLDNVEVISTYGGETKLRTYELNYTVRDFLASVGLEGMDDEKVKETFFGRKSDSYRDRFTSFSPSYAVGQRGHMNMWVVGDFNNSGTDVFLPIIYNETYNYYGVGYTDVSSYQAPKVVYTGDFNGDHRADCVIGVEIDGEYRYEVLRAAPYNTDDNIDFMNSINTFTANKIDNDILCGDFDGDEKDEILVKSTMSMYDEQGNNLNIDNTPIAKLNNEDTKILVGNFLGKQKDRICIVNNKELKCYEFNSGTFEQVCSLSFEENIVTINQGDFNGDGLADIYLFLDNVSEGTYLYSKGDGSYSVENIRDNFYVGDDRFLMPFNYNEDGITDFVQVLLYDNGIVEFEVYVNGGDGSYTDVGPYDVYLPQEIDPLALDFKIGDDNGDGKDDLFFCVSEGEFVVLDLVTDEKLDFKISKFTTPLKTIEIQYESFSTTGLNANDDEGNISAKSFVGKSLVKNVKVNGVNSLSIGYADSYYSFDKESFLGFKNFTVNNTKTGNTTIYTNAYDATHQRLKKDKLTNSIDGAEISQNIYYNNIKPISDDLIRIELDSVEQKNLITGTSVKNKYTYDEGNISSQVVSYYDDGEMIDSISHSTSFLYPNNGNWIDNYPSKVTKTSTKGDEVIVRTIDNEYYPTGKLKKRITDQGAASQVNRDYIYDGYGNTKTITQTAPNDNNTTTQTVEFVYTDDARFVKSKTVQGLTTSYQYNHSLGVLTSETTPSGLTTRHFYDDMGRRYKSLSPIGVESYTTLNWVPSKDASNPNPAADDAPADALYYSFSETSGIAPSKTYYNKSGQALRIVSQGFVDSQVIYSDVEYYDDGKVKRKSLPYLSTIDDEDIQWTTYLYEDDYNRLSKVVYADGSEMQKEYLDTDRKIVTCITNTLNGVTKTQTDTVEVNALGQTIASSDHIGNTVTYSYDAAGRLRNSFVDEDHITSFTYDLLGNRTSINDPDAGCISSVFNAYGQLMSTTNARNQTTSYQYDALGRLDIEETTEVKSGNPIVLDKLDYDYISSGTAIGQLSRIKKDNALVESYTYDNLGRMNGKTEYIGSQSFTHSHTYDDYGRIATQIYPGGYKLINSYTPNGDLDYITQEVNGVTSRIYENIAFSAQGALTQYKLGNTYTFDRKYDPYGKLETLESDFQDLEYTFDPLGNFDSRINDHSGMEEHFAYDDLNRLTDVELYNMSEHLPAYNKTMLYQNNGNILTKTGVGANMVYGENNKPHALTSINTPMGYQPPDQTIGYTYFNKADLITQEAYTYQYTYGADKQRRKTVYKNGATTLRTKYYLGNYEKVIESDGTVKEYHYLNANCGMFGIFVKTNGVGELKYTLTDHLGSLTGIVNATTGNVEHSVSFGAWGNPRSADWKTDYSGSLFADRGFTGHEHLPSAFGLIDMNGRMYDPVLGRFLSPDPYVQDAGYSQSFNRYSYCLNNPLLYTDPDGELPVLAAVAIYVGFIYLKTAHDNRDPVTGKWEWNPSNWFGDNGTFIVGGSTSSDGSSWSVYGGYGNGEYMPMIGYNNNYGMGMGYGDNNGSHMYYPNQTKQMAENDKIVSGKFDGAVEGMGRFYDAQSQGYSGEVIFWKTWTEYMKGRTDPLVVNTTALNLGHVSQSDLREDGSVNLANPKQFKQRAFSGTALALGNITFIPQGNNMYRIKNDLYDFDHKPAQGWSFRNVATAGAGLIHGGVFDNRRTYLPLRTPIYVKGYPIVFTGTVYLKP